MSEFHKTQLSRHLRNGRTLFPEERQSPERTRRELLAAHAFAREGMPEGFFEIAKSRAKRQGQ